MEIAGKVALVTGGGRGIGRACIEALLKAGAKVCFCDVNTTLGQSTLSELQSKYGEKNVYFRHCDVTRQADMESLFQQTKDRFKRLDIVLNNAGLGGELYPAWEKAVDVNLKGTIRGTLIALENMRTDKSGDGGVIINMSSAAGLNINPLSPVYCATKSAIIAFSRSLASNKEASGGVRLNVLCPTFVETGLLDDLSDQNCYDVEKAHQFIEKIGIMRLEEVADAFMELVRDVTKNGAVLKCSKADGKQYVSIEVKTLPT